MKRVILLLSWGIVASCGTPPSYTKTLADEQGTSEQDSKVGKIAAGVAVGAVIAVGAACIAMNLKKRCIPIIKRMGRNTKKAKSAGFETEKPSSSTKNAYGDRSAGFETEKPSSSTKNAYGDRSTGFETEKPSSSAKNAYRDRSTGFETEKPSSSAKNAYRDRSNRHLSASEEPSKSPDHNTHSNANSLDDFAIGLLLLDSLSDKRTHSTVDAAGDVLDRSAIDAAGDDAASPLSNWLHQNADIFSPSNTRGYSASDPLFGYDTTLSPSPLGQYDFGTPEVDVGFDLPFF